MGFISKVELKKQLQEMGIKVVEGNYIRKQDIKKIVLTASNFYVSDANGGQTKDIRNAETFSNRDEAQKWIEKIYGKKSNMVVVKYPYDGTDEESYIIKIKGNYVREKDIVAIRRSNSLRYGGKIYEIHTTKYKNFEDSNKVSYVVVNNKPFEIDFPEGVVQVDRDVRDFSLSTIFELKPSEKLRPLQKNELEDGGQGY